MEHGHPTATTHVKVARTTPYEVTNQLDAEAARRSSAVDLGTPAFADIANRTTITTDQHHR
ncbi:hypothetical protein AB0919_43595 [Streptomyces sp. NPDC046994]|uniref:hypothetical protein n=1 Tax=unclassified Streptomyces TaxID=2593676 RepID=UPI0033E87FE4